MRNSKQVMEFIKKKKEDLGLSSAELARRTGVAKSSISRYENGTREFPINEAPKFAKALNITLEELLGIQLISTTDIVAIPVIGTISCGDPITAEENIVGCIHELETNLPSGELFALECKGESMSPLINDKSRVIIRLQNDVENNEIAAVLINGDTEATLKRIKKQDDQIILMPENPNFDPIIVNESNPARILGKAVLVSQAL